MYRFFVLALINLSFFGILSCQKTVGDYNWEDHYEFTEADSIRGGLNAMRTCFDVKKYDLDIEVFPDSKFIKGSVRVFAQATRDLDKLQLDLFRNMKINEVLCEEESLSFTRIHDAFIVEVSQDSGALFSLQIDYEGVPTQARRAPWDGGFVWKEDKNGQHWIGVACEGDGASLWWPNKDHLSDEPESMDIIVTVPAPLTCVSNGDLVSSSITEDKNRFHWKVEYPINNYNVSLNIADYVHFQDGYESDEKGTMPMDYYVLSYNEEKAKKHFKQSHDVLRALEEWFGPFPYWNDGFALVETPYLGMEHQTAIAYGNNYMRGYLGYLKPNDLNFDYIIVHETGHEYWGNSVSAKDHAELWIHESFCTYTEALFVEYMHDYEKSVEYLMTQKRSIMNKQPMVGPIGVNFTSWSGSDIYYKGAWVIHTFRSVLGEQQDWKFVLRAFYDHFQGQQISTEDVVNFFNEYLDADYSKFWEQYLYRADIPSFEYEWITEDDQTQLKYRWVNVIEGFEMPFELRTEDNIVHRLNVSSEWQSKNLDKTELLPAIDRFLVKVKA